MRKNLINQLADTLEAIDLDHPVRVGIDGITAAGKTVLADELATTLRLRGRHVVRASLDGFHHPSSHRYRQGRSCPVGYFEDSFDYQAVINHILAPLGPKGTLRYCPEVYDHASDKPVDKRLYAAHPDAILLFEGVMLFRPELDDFWDYRIYVHLDFDTGLLRAIDRDAIRFGSEDTVRDKHATRFRPGQERYLTECRPRERAHAVIDNRDPTRPVLEQLKAEG